MRDYLSSSGCFRTMLYANGQMTPVPYRKRWSTDTILQCTIQYASVRQWNIRLLYWLSNVYCTIHSSWSMNRDKVYKIDLLSTTPHHPTSRSRTKWCGMVRFIYKTATTLIILVNYAIPILILWKSNDHFEVQFYVKVALVTEMLLIPRLSGS